MIALHDEMTADEVAEVLRAAGVTVRVYDSLQHAGCGRQPWAVTGDGRVFLARDAENPNWSRIPANLAAAEADREAERLRNELDGEDR